MADVILSHFSSNVSSPPTCRKNSADGEGSFKKIDDLDGDLLCEPSGLHFIDWNGDGLEDLVCVEEDGSLSLSINQGNGDEQTPPAFKRVGKVKGGEGKRERVRLADIDGDGRADYGVIQDDGKVKFWRNGGVDDDTETWEFLGVRWDSGEQGKEDVGGIRFEDINGDVR